MAVSSLTMTMTMMKNTIKVLKAANLIVPAQRARITVPPEVIYVDNTCLKFGDDSGDAGMLLIVKL